MMSGIRGANTKPELTIRSGLHALGFRFRLHANDVPGKPDLVLPRYRAAIFVNGCFWHHHDCHLFRLPSTRTEFWQNKIEGNVRRDAKVRALLANAGWRQLVVWECALKGRTRLDPDDLMQRISKWLRSEKTTGEIRGKS
jgi:DNA mismatch endonuclease (patch repair protein)